MTHFFLSSVSHTCSFGIVVESLNFDGCSSDILSISVRKPALTFNPVWRTEKSNTIASCMRRVPHDRNN